MGVSPRGYRKISVFFGPPESEEYSSYSRLFADYTLSGPLQKRRFQVMLYDTVIEHRLHYERVLDPNDELGERGFECVIVPLISGLRIAIFKPVASALADVLRFGAERLLLDAIESALSKAAPLVRVSLQFVKMLEPLGYHEESQIAMGGTPCCTP